MGIPTSSGSLYRLFVFAHGRKHMASCIPFADEEPFAQRVKTLADDELLEIWEETQQIENMICAELHADFSLAPDYEKVIVEELTLRSSRRINTRPEAK